MIRPHFVLEEVAYYFMKGLFPIQYQMLHILPQNYTVAHKTIAKLTITNY